MFQYNPGKPVAEAISPIMPRRESMGGLSYHLDAIMETFEEIENVCEIIKG